MEESAAENLSIVIINYNGGDDIIECLASIRKSDAKFHSSEVIIVDNASTDSSPSNIRKRFPEALLIENKENRGFAAAANQGFARSAGDAVVFLNPDTVLEHDFFEQLGQFLENNPQAFFIGCKLVDARGSQQPSCWRAPTLNTLLLEAFLPYTVSLWLVSQKPHEAQEVDVVSGACMVVRRDAFERLGGFDERFFMYYEDADLCFRARQSGLQILFCPKAVAFHRVGGSPWADSTSFFLTNYKSKLMFFRKHFSSRYQRTAKVIVVAGILLRIPSYLIAGIVSINMQLIRLSRYHFLILSKVVRM